MYSLLLRLMFLLPPERIHHLAFTAMRLAARFAPSRWVMTKILTTDDPILRNHAFGIDFPAPLGLAAGFDKNADGVDAWAPSDSVSPRSGPSPRRRSPVTPHHGCSGCPPTTA